MTDPIDTELAIAATEISKADSKAAALLSAGGILATALGLITTGDHPNPAAMATAAVTLAASLILSALVIRPRLAGTDRASFLHWATVAPDELAAELAEDRRAAKLVVLSQITARKMTTLRWATDITIAAVIAIAVAAALSATN